MAINIWKALLYKKYTLKSKAYQILFIGGAAFFICVLSLIPFQLNGSGPVQLSLTNFLSIIVFLFISCGLLSGQIEINYHESIQLGLLVGSKSKTIFYSLTVEVMDYIFQSFFIFGMINVLYGVLYSGQEIQILRMLSFVLGGCTFAFLAYFLTLCFESAMIALAILLIFPLIISPYLERMFPNTVPLVIYNAITASINSSQFGISHWYLFILLILVIALTYLQFRKQA
ncbi:hypothetical protein [Enterococcus sp. HY326]|uniref:hypothetical protein n=1 Tax=Enterococcus sp. HY326 TaxID=2971265 RepID=UPI002240E1BF|nr:hypothetical protein [Enterococcus sp. HY326]